MSLVQSRAAGCRLFWPCPSDGGWFDRKTRTRFSRLRSPQGRKEGRAVQRRCREEDVVERLRAETPGTEFVSHFNNAGAALPPKVVVAAVLNHIQLEAQIGGYEAARREEAAVQRPYDALAQLLNCRAQEIAVVNSATRGWQQAFFGLPLRQTDCILTSVAEYGSNFINYLQLSQRCGTKIKVVPETADNDIDLEALEQLIRYHKQTPSSQVLVSISHVPTSSGRVYDAEGVGRVASGTGAWYLLDACQSAGQLPLDVQRIQCHFLTATGRKYLRGPRGSGFLYASQDALQQFEPAALDVWGARWVDQEEFVARPTARRYEEFEMSVAAKVGLGVAVDYCNRLGMDFIHQRVTSLAGLMRRRLNTIPSCTVHDCGRQLCGIVSFTLDGLDAGVVQQRLSAEGINVSVSRASSSRTAFSAQRLSEVVRASVHYYNTSAEVERLVAAVAGLDARSPC